MRNVERLREKTEISLDGKQVAAMAVVALLLFGGVFAVGLVVGRNSAPAQPAAEADVAALDEVHKGQAAQAVPSRPTPGKAEQPAARPAAPPEEPPAPPEKHDTAQGRPPLAHVAQATVVDAPRGTATVPAPRPAAFVPAPPSVLSRPPRDAGNFTVQVGASQDRGEAQRLESKARGAGLKPYLVEVDLGVKGTWYRVRVGAFKERTAADHFRKDVERELRSAAVVMPTH
jgi:cell division septation protein DedD